MVAFLNIAGLSLAFTVVFIVAIQVNYDFSYNHSIPDYKNIYRVKYHFLSRYGFTTSTPIMDKLVSDIPELSNYGIVRFPKNNIGISLDRNVEPFSETEISSYTLDKNMLQILSPSIIIGDTTVKAEGEEVAILSESTARRMFGKENCINKTLYHGELAIRIIAVMKDIPRNNTFSADIWLLGRFDTESASDWSYVMYAKLKPNQADLVTKKMKDIYDRRKDREDEENIYSSILFSIDPIRDIYMIPIPELQEADKTTTITLLSVGALILLIALFNLL
ncbi:MAG: ABC transporter permease, partial [Bacteroidales bacterium]